MCRRNPGVVLICGVCLATGCGRPSSDATFTAGSSVTLDQVSQGTASASSLHTEMGRTAETPSDSEGAQTENQRGGCVSCRFLSQFRRSLTLEG
jgi:hypothetical protein